MADRLLRRAACAGLRGSTRLLSASGLTDGGRRPVFDRPRLEHLAGLAAQPLGSSRVFTVNESARCGWDGRDNDGARSLSPLACVVSPRSIKPGFSGQPSFPLPIL